ncbi:MAG: hypothetical protein PHR12_07045 [Victivallaceae bacterium]|nr:hypothetical protein [Victivallaceae bacterium]
MKVKLYKIFDFIDLAWHKPRWSIVPDFAIKYHYFQVDSLEQSKSPVRIHIHQGIPPSLENSVQSASERFACGDNAFALQHQHGRMRWKSLITDLESNDVHIYYEFPIYHQLQWPWFLFPDHLICFQVIQPVIEYKLQQHSVATLHAGAATNPVSGKTILLSGRGGVNKTTYLMKLLAEGWLYLSDDLVLLHEGKLFPYPMCDTFFDYFYLHAENENVTAKTMLGALLHVRKGAPVSFPVSSPSKPTAVFLLIAAKQDHSELVVSGHVDEHILEKMLVVDRLERLTFVDEEEVTGRFMLQLNQVYGNDCWNKFWAMHRKLLKDNLYGLPFFELYSGKKPDVDLFNQLCN